MTDKNRKAIIILKNIIKSWLPIKVKYDHIPGLSVGIYHKGRLVYADGFGYANLEKKTPATKSTRFRIGSISKMFTAVAILQLQEMGALNINDEVSVYFPEIEKSNFGNIKIKQLLSHTSGLRRDSNTPHWADDKFPNFSEVNKTLNEKIIVFRNSGFKYSNLGFVLLGEIVERVSGMEYGKYVSENILKNLKMNSTSTDDFKQDVKKSIGYSRSIPGKRRSKINPSRSNAYASAAGFISNVPDLSRFISALNPIGESKILLSTDSKKLLSTKVCIVPKKENEWYGLGVTINKISGREVIGHGGGYSGFIAYASLDIKDDLGVITLSNSVDSTAVDINRGILESYYKLIDNKEFYLKPSMTLKSKRYEGLFRDRWNDTVIVSVGAGLMAFDPRVSSPIVTGMLLKPAGYHRFLMSRETTDSPGEYIIFEINKGKSRADRLIWSTMPMERVGA